MPSRHTLYGLAAALHVASAAAPARANDEGICGGFVSQVPLEQIAACTRLIDRGDPTEFAYNWWDSRGRVYQKLGQYARAIDDYNKALARATGKTNVYFARAETYEKLGRRADAIRDYRTILELEDVGFAVHARRALARLGARSETDAPPTQRPGASRVDEVRRKANARERENGFCSRVPWPVLSWGQIASFLDRAVAGDLLVDRSDEYCLAMRIVLIGNSGGDRCIRTQRWNCDVGKECTMTFGSWCKRGADYSEENCRCQ